MGIRRKKKASLNWIICWWGYTSMLAQLHFTRSLTKSCRKSPHGLVRNMAKWCWHQRQSGCLTNPAKRTWRASISRFHSKWPSHRAARLMRDFPIISARLTHPEISSDNGKIGLMVPGHSSVLFTKESVHHEWSKWWSSVNNTAYWATSNRQWSDPWNLRHTVGDWCRRACRRWPST